MAFDVAVEATTATSDLWAAIQPDAIWKGRTGRVQAHLAEAVGERRDIDVLLCGLKEMVDDLRRTLKEMGFDRKRIRYEKYD